MKILVTGAFGFVGSNVAEYFKSHSNYTLLALDIDCPKNNQYSKCYSWQELDLIDWDDINCIIHLAGKAHDTKQLAEAEEYFKINVNLTKEIFQYFLRFPIDKFIYFSSVKAAADTLTDTPLSEDYPPNPLTPYGKSKYESEKYLLSIKVDRTKEVLILRPAMIHGPGNKGNLNLLYSIFRHKIPYPLGAYSNKRTFTSMHNLLYIIDRILSQKVDSGVYNVSDDDSVSTLEIVQILNRSFNRVGKVWNLPKPIINFAAYVGYYLHLPLNPERIKKLTETYVVSNSKIKNQLGIPSLPVGAKEGLMSTFRSFQP